MTKFMSALLFTAATIAAPALADPASSPIAFQRGGIHYIATVTDRADGSSLIAGHEVESGRAFELMVAKGMVQGVYDHQPVAYDAPRFNRAAPAASVVIASNTTGM